MKKPREIRTAATTTEPTTGPAIQARLSLLEGEGEGEGGGGGELVTWIVISIIKRLLQGSSSIPEAAFRDSVEVMSCSEIENGSLGRGT